MNTFRKLSLIALVGVATAPAYTMYAEDLAQNLTDALDEAKASQSISSAATSDRLAQVEKSVIKNGGQFIKLATDHPYRTFGIVALVVAAGGTTYVLYKNGTLKTIKQAMQNHKIATGVITATIAAGGTYVAAKQMGYDLSLSSAKNQVSTVGSFIYNKLPNKPNLSIPSWDTTKSYLFNLKTAGIGATLLGVGYVVNKYYNGSTKDTKGKQPELSKKDQTTTNIGNTKTTNQQKASWLPSLFGGSSTSSSIKPPIRPKASIQLLEDKIRTATTTTKQSTTKQSTTKQSLDDAQSILNELLSSKALKHGSSYQSRINNLRNTILN